MWWGMDQGPCIGNFDELAFRKMARGLKQRANQEACAYWDLIRAGRRMPLRRGFDPAAVPRLLPSVILLDVLRSPLDFRYRLIGTRWVMHFDRDDTGRMMSEIDHQRAPSLVWQAAEEVASVGMPQSPKLPYVGKLFGRREIEVLISPLSREGSTVDFLLVTIDFSS